MLEMLEGSLVIAMVFFIVVLLAQSLLDVRRYLRRRGGR